MPTNFRGDAVPYRPRIVDVEFHQRLSSAGAVVIEGPKASGKTAAGEQIAASRVYRDLEPRLRAMADHVLRQQHALLSASRSPFRLAIVSTPFGYPSVSLGKSVP